MSSFENNSQEDSSKKYPKYNLVYLGNIPEIIADEEVLKSKQFLGHYGEIVKLEIKKKFQTVSDKFSAKKKISVYVNYKNVKDACIAILALNQSTLNNQKIEAHFGTTKICRYFLKNRRCLNQDCQFIHSSSPFNIKKGSCKSTSQFSRLKKNRLIRFFLDQENSEQFILQNINKKYQNVFLPSKKISLWKIFSYAKNNQKDFYKSLLSKLKQNNCKETHKPLVKVNHQAKENILCNQFDKMIFTKERQCKQNNLLEKVNKKNTLIDIRLNLFNMNRTKVL